MLAGQRLRLRPLREKDLNLLETWAEHREQGIGHYQPYILGQGAIIRKALSGNLEPQR